MTNNEHTIISAPMGRDELVDALKEARDHLRDLDADKWQAYSDTPRVLRTIDAALAASRPPSPESAPMRRDVARENAIHAAAHALCFIEHGDHRYDPGKKSHIRQWYRQAEAAVDAAAPWLAASRLPAAAHEDWVDFDECPTCGAAAGRPCTPTPAHLVLCPGRPLRLPAAAETDTAWRYKEAPPYPASLWFLGRPGVDAARDDRVEYATVVITPVVPGVAGAPTTKEER